MDPPESPPVLNALTIDVEEYFQVSLFKGHARPGAWDAFPRRAADSVRRLLDLLASHDAKATFFTLGWVAEREKSLIREIAAAGHELASHGYAHRELTGMARWQFRADLACARSAIEDLSGVRVSGFRAPSWSIVPSTLWALEVLAEENYTFDSSIFPIRHDRYGIPDRPRVPHRIPTASGPIVEVPPATARFLGQNLPVAGGGYLRHFPPAVIRWGLRQMNRDGIPAVVYLHPWEIDPAQPRIDVPAPTRVRHYRNLDKVFPRLDALMGEFRFGTISQLLETFPAREIVPFGAKSPDRVAALRPQHQGA